MPIDLFVVNNENLLKSSRYQVFIEQSHYILVWYRATEDECHDADRTKTYWNVISTDNCYFNNYDIFILIRI